MDSLHIGSHFVGFIANKELCGRIYFIFQSIGIRSNLFVLSKTTISGYIVSFMGNNPTRVSTGLNVSGTTTLRRSVRGAQHFKVITQIPGSIFLVSI